MRQTSSRHHVLTRVMTFTCLLSALLCMSAGQVAAQEDLDIPGLDKTVAPTKSTMDLDVGIDQGEVTLWGLLRSGGWCMWPLGLFSIAIVALCIYNIFELRNDKFCPVDLITFLQGRMHYCAVQEAYDAAHDSSSFMGQMFAQGLTYVDMTDGSTLGRERALDAMHEFSARASRRHMLWINYFGILAQASPMLGLLGTVSGMIKAFSTMGRGGMGDPSLLAGNISEALVTTATGLTIALPALFCFFVFRNMLAQLVGRCHDAAEDLIADLVDAVAGQTRAAATPVEPEA